jgi:hypothetical protein
MAKVFLTMALIAALWSSFAVAQAAPAATPSATTAAPPRTVARPMPPPSRAAPLSGDGPANALNSFVMKEITQCRTLPAYERRACCEKVLHPNACTD